MSTFTQESNKKAKIPSTAIDILNNDTAKLYTHIHPIIVLSLYAFKFPSIVKDPVPALTNTLIWLGILQIAYAAICLPPTGGGTASAGKSKPGEKRKKDVGKLENNINATIIPAFLSLIASVLVATPVLSGTLVLFGAPITTHHAHTILCAAHVSFLAIVPLVYVHGIEGETWREIVALLKPVDEVYGGMIGAVVGAWLGAVPIPLDWDREWQKWPVTIVTGAYIGFAVGKLLGGTLLKGKHIMFE